MPKTIKDLAVELIKKHKDLEMSCDLCVSQFVNAILSLVSECVGKDELINQKRAIERNDAIVRNIFRKNLKSALAERSGIK
jgi:hypothetical protein